jgi:hypothetical protein
VISGVGEADIRLHHRVIFLQAVSQGRRR